MRAVSRASPRVAVLEPAAPQPGCSRPWARQRRVARTTPALSEAPSPNTRSLARLPSPHHDARAPDGRVPGAAARARSDAAGLDAPTGVTPALQQRSRSALRGRWRSACLPQRRARTRPRERRACGCSQLGHVLRAPGQDGIEPPCCRVQPARWRSRQNHSLRCPSPNTTHVGSRSVDELGSKARRATGGGMENRAASSRSGARGRAPGRPRVPARGRHSLRCRRLGRAGRRLQERLRRARAGSVANRATLELRDWR
jgi:hypothetical protein